MTSDSTLSGQPHLFIPERPASHPSRRGRPKGAKNIRPMVERIAFEKHKTKDRHGNTVRLTTVQLVIHKLQLAALSGNHRAAAIRDRYFGNYIEPDLHSMELSGVVLAPADVNPEEWIAEQQYKNARMAQLMEEIIREEAGKP